MLKCRSYVPCLTLVTDHLTFVSRSSLCHVGLSHDVFCVEALNSLLDVNPHALLASQAGLTPVLTEALLAVGLLDPVSPETGIRVSEEILMMLGNLTAVPSARASPAAFLALRVVDRAMATPHLLPVTRQIKSTLCPGYEHDAAHDLPPALLRR